MEISCPRMTVFKISRDDLIEALGRYIKVNAQIQTREHTLADLVFTYLTSLQFWLNKICKHVDLIFVMILSVASSPHFLKKGHIFSFHQHVSRRLFNTSPTKKLIPLPDQLPNSTMRFFHENRPW